MIRFPGYSLMDNETSQLHTHPSLLIRLRDARDGAAWALFVEIYTPLIYRYCRKRHLQEADAAEVAQEVPVSYTHLTLPTILRV